MQHPKLWFYVAAVLALGFFCLFVWQWLDKTGLRREYKRERGEIVKKHETELDQLAQKHAKELDAQAKQLLRTSGVLLARALQPPMAAGDYDAVEKLVKPLLKEKPIMIIAIADETGTIKLATNHKLEGRQLREAFPSVAGMETGEVSVAHDKGALVTFVPVQDGDRRLGAAAVFYKHVH